MAVPSGSRSLETLPGERFRPWCRSPVPGSHPAERIGQSERDKRHVTSRLRLRSNEHQVARRGLRRLLLSTGSVSGPDPTSPPLRSVGVVPPRKAAPRENRPCICRTGAEDTCGEPEIQAQSCGLDSDCRVATLPRQGALARGEGSALSISEASYGFPRIIY